MQNTAYVFLEIFIFLAWLCWSWKVKTQERHRSRTKMHTDLIYLPLLSWIFSSILSTQTTTWARFGRENAWSKVPHQAPWLYPSTTLALITVCNDNVVTIALIVILKNLSQVLNLTNGPIPNPTLHFCIWPILMSALTDSANHLFTWGMGKGEVRVPPSGIQDYAPAPVKYRRRVKKS